jgi:hypothetical protein
VQVAEKTAGVYKFRHIEFVDVDIETPPDLKDALSAAVARWPASWAGVQKIHLESKVISGGMYVLGLYDGRNIWLSINGLTREEVITTLYHELGHSIMRSMPNDEWHAWYRLYQYRLKQWKDTGDFIFVSRYSASTVHEFFAEHVSMLSVMPAEHAEYFGLEHALFVKQNYLPI